jgi:hypothetical protein
MGVYMNDLSREICQPVLKLDFYGAWPNGIPEFHCYRSLPPVAPPRFLINSIYLKYF